MYIIRHLYAIESNILFLFNFHDHFLNLFFEFRSRSSVMGQNDSEEVVKLHHEVIEQAKYQGSIFLWIWLTDSPDYFKVRNKRKTTLIDFWNFFKGLQFYYRLIRFKFYYISLHILRGYFYSFCQIFQRLCLLGAAVCLIFL